MKLTVALGLQYDSNKLENFYALSFGRKHTVAAVKAPTEDLLGKAVIARPATWDIRWFILTYNLHGLPVMQPKSAGIDLFV